MIAPTGAPGGAERAFIELARHLPSAGWMPRIVLLERGPVEEWFEDAGLSFEVIDAGRLRQIHRTGAVIRRLASMAREEGVDAILGNQTKAHLYGGPAGLLASTPEAWWQQGVPDEPRAMDRIAARVPTAAIVCSSDLAIRAQSRLTPREKLAKIHLGIDLQHIAEHGGNADVDVHLEWDDHPVVGIVGRLEPWKGQDVFLRAMGKVNELYPEARFAVVGGAVLGWEGDYPDDLRRLSLELGIADRTHFAGHQEDVYPWFDALDVVVHASIGEPFGLVLVEAMALGKPVVASASGGPTEIIEDGVSGILYPPGDDAALADEVIGLLEDDKRRGRIGDAARMRAQRFSSERMAASFAALLDRIAGRGDEGERDG